jgi:calcineurin-like phosphoesterase family protein
MSLELPLDRKIWVISDTHFGHDNIIKYEGRPKDHDSLMIRNIWGKLGMDDCLLHLGDVTLTSRPKAREWCNRLPKYTILIEGNHDKRANNGKIRQWANFVRLKHQPVVVEYEGLKIALAHRFVDVRLAEADLYLFGHSHSKGSKYFWQGKKLFINCCVEHWDYQPILLNDLVAFLRDSLAGTNCTNLVRRVFKYLSGKVRSWLLSRDH